MNSKILRPRHGTLMPVFGSSTYWLQRRTLARKMGEQAEFALAIPAAYQQFLATEKMAAPQLSTCVYLPRDRDGSISITLSERLPNISVVGN